MLTISRTVSSRISAPIWSMAPTAPGGDGRAGAMPKRVAVPRSGGRSPSIMSMVVDLPAPFGPSSATVWPRGIERLTPRTARTGPAGPRNDFSSPGG